MKRLDRRISKKMKKVNLYVSKARGYYLNQEWEPALREYAQLARYNRSDDNLYLELGIIYGNLLQYEDALTALYSGLLINPNNVEIHRLLSDYCLSASVRNSIMGFIHLTRYLEKAPDSKTRAGLKEKYDNLLAKFSARKMFPRLGSLTSSQNRDIHALYKGR
ncbi:MAG: tetratricopeptide repeat protein [Nitrospinales bacterium]